MFCGINVFQPKVTQHSAVFQPGEKLVITAGVGSYSTEAQPEVIIKNDTIKKTNNAVAIYSVAVSKLKGKYSLPVTICCINENGIAVKEVIPISWTVR